MWKVLAATIATALAVGVAIHEWSYHRNHPYAPGVSAVLTILALAVVLNCIATAVHVWRDEQERRRRAIDFRAKMEAASIHGRPVDSEIPAGSSASSGDNKPKHAA